MDGSPRALHVDDALAVTRWDQPREEALWPLIRVQGGPADVEGPAQVRVFAGPGGLSSSHLRVARLEGTGETELPKWERLRSVTTLAGTVQLGSITVSAGQTAAIPAEWRGQALLRGAHAIVAATTSH